MQFTLELQHFSKGHNWNFISALRQHTIDNAVELGKLQSISATKEPIIFDIFAIVFMDGK